MGNELPYQRILEDSLKGELRILNAHLPGEQKPLLDLLDQEFPGVVCSDGSAHLFKRKELEFLESITDTDEQKTLLLPMLIEVNAVRDETAIMCYGAVEEKVVSKILDMPVTTKQRRITIYRPQLALIRKLIKTTTQYLFSPKILE